uniref:Uncharacterized protein n=1 Tax=viral metagenome TaxID=1070528 RepID=A0A6C0J686_9ZZZZ
MAECGNCCCKCRDPNYRRYKKDLVPHSLSYTYTGLTPFINIYTLSSKNKYIFLTIYFFDNIFF